MVYAANGSATSNTRRVPAEIWRCPIFASPVPGVALTPLPHSLDLIGAAKMIGVLQFGVAHAEFSYVMRGRPVISYR